MGMIMTSSPPQQTYTLLRTAVFTTGQQANTISGLNFTGYKQIYIRLVGKLTGAMVTWIQINGDSTAGNYVYELQTSQTTTVSASAPASATNMQIGHMTTQISGSQLWIELISGEMPHIQTMGGDNAYITFSSGNYQSTTAITSMTFSTNNAGIFWDTGTYIEFYGVI